LEEVKGCWLYMKWVVECAGEYVKRSNQELTHNIRENKIFTLRTKCKEEDKNVSLESKFTPLVVIASLFFLCK